MLKPGEDVWMNFSVSAPSKPEAYGVEVLLKKDDVVLAREEGRLVVEGVSGRIQYLIPDRDSYGKGDGVVVNYRVAGSVSASTYPFLERYYPEALPDLPGSSVPSTVSMVLQLVILKDGEVIQSVSKDVVFEDSSSPFISGSVNFTAGEDLCNYTLKAYLRSGGVVLDTLVIETVASAVPAVTTSVPVSTLSSTVPEAVSPDGGGGGSDIIVYVVVVLVLVVLAVLGLLRWRSRGAGVFLLFLASFILVNSVVVEGTWHDYSFCDTPCVRRWHGCGNYIEDCCLASKCVDSEMLSLGGCVGTRERGECGFSGKRVSCRYGFGGGLGSGGVALDPSGVSRCNGPSLLSNFYCNVNHCEASVVEECNPGCCDAYCGGSGSCTGDNCICSIPMTTTTTISLPPCPYEESGYNCVSVEMCGLFNGVERLDYGCPVSSDVCCYGGECPVAHAGYSCVSSAECEGFGGSPLQDYPCPVSGICCYRAVTTTTSTISTTSTSLVLTTSTTTTVSVEACDMDDGSWDKIPALPGCGVKDTTGDGKYDTACCGGEETKITIR